MIGTIGCTPGRIAKPASVIAARKRRVFASSRSRRAAGAREQLEARERGADDERGGSVFEKRYGRERWRRRSTISRRRGREAAAGAAERLAERGGHDVDAAGDAAVLRRAAAGLAEEAGGVAVVDHDERVVALGQVADLGERRDVAVHGEDAVGGDQARPRARACPRAMRSRSAMSAVLVAMALAPGRAGCRR